MENLWMENSKGELLWPHPTYIHLCSIPSQTVFIVQVHVSTKSPMLDCGGYFSQGMMYANG